MPGYIKGNFMVAKAMGMKTIGITGGTGLVGRELTRLLIEKGYNVVVFTTGKAAASTSQISYSTWNANTGAIDTTMLARLDAMVHLAGAPIAEKRWTTERKLLIKSSRVEGTSFIVSQLKEHARNCKTFVSASAIGFYGADKAGHGAFTETDPMEPGFLGETCQEWEHAAGRAAAFARVVIIRVGIVMGEGGGMFAELIKPLSFGILPILGGGRQVVSWVSVHDIARIFLFAVENEQLSGTYNGVAPEPASQHAIAQAIAATKGGIAIPAPAPAFMLRLMLGEMSIEVLKSCTASAAKIQAAGFTFAHKRIQDATAWILGK